MKYHFHRKNERWSSSPDASKMQAFPLYEELKRKSASVSSDVEWTKVTTALCNLEKDQAEVVMALIHHHREIERMLSPSIKLSPFPYNGKGLDGNVGYTVQWNNIPLDLKKILYAYIESVNE